MYKIAISGKANSGKDTVAKNLCSAYYANDKIQSGKYPMSNMIVAFADPIKEIILKMFPRTPVEYLYGPSENRLKIIPNAFKNDKPLSYRMLLQELGTEIGRGYNKNIWLDILDFKAEQAEKQNIGLFIVSDVRFRNEFDHVKKQGYSLIRVVRDSQLSMTHSSESEQNEIENCEFNIIIDNNKTLGELYINCSEIIRTMLG